jgi:hypothetical protein
MDAWSDEGRVFFLDTEPVATLGQTHKDDSAALRPELDGRMVSIDAISILLERGRFEAATALYACQLELQVADASPYDDAPVWVVMKAPAELVFTLGNLDRDVAWFVREAISEALPKGYQASEFFVQAQLGSAPCGEEKLVAA